MTDSQEQCPETPNANEVTLALHETAESNDSSSNNSSSSSNGSRTSNSSSTSTSTIASSIADVSKDLTHTSSSKSVRSSSKSVSSNCSSSNSSSGNCSSSSSSSSSKRIWTPEMQDVMVEVCLRTLNYGTRRDLERRVRSGTGSELKASHSCCSASQQQQQEQQQQLDSGCCKKHSSCAHGSHAAAGKGETADKTAAPPVYSFCKDASDELGKRLDDWTSSETLKTIVGAVCERSARVYNNVVAKAIKEGMTFEKGGPDDRHLHDEIFKEALLRELQLRIAHELRKDRLQDSREGGLLANPSGYQEGPLSYLSPETIRGLMVEGVAVQHGFLGEEMRKNVLKEMELLDFDGRFNEVFQQSMLDLRKDFMCWALMSDLDREKEQGLRHLLKCLFALPFELNKKANLCLQVGWVVQLAVFPGNGSFYRKHFDGGFSDFQNNGRKITAIYYPNPTDWKEEDGGSLLVYRRRSRREQEKDANCLSIKEEEPAVKRVVPKGDTLVLLRSRDMPHEVTETFRKRFAVSLYMAGPPGPGDD